VNWNLLWGFPGERAEDYEAELSVLRRIGHLEPPIGGGRIWLERFSPNYNDRTAFPVANVRPEASYSFVYPSTVDLMRAAYFFDYEMGDTLPSCTHQLTHDYVTQWRDVWGSEARHSLSYRKTAHGILIDFNQGVDRQGTYSVSGVNALIYEYCGEIHSSAGVQQHLRELSADYEFQTDEIEGALDEFCSADLMLKEDGRYLSLALPSNPNW
jgi:hypothetical protein